MTEQLENELKLKRVLQMTRPTILMHPTDLKSLTDKVKSTVVGFKESKIPTFGGVPIKSTEFTEVGKFIFYDDAIYNCT